MKAWDCDQNRHHIDAHPKLRLHMNEKPSAEAHLHDPGRRHSLAETGLLDTP